ncbi:rhodopsin, GQ-coupled isoform X2 [Hydra vulgaris]|uniref:Rhodopsin, GQ-coupled isoform X2 n=1 Tax=Hydra vulgaris TaxID=6087 RepID=A0ABM4BE48_HYDVU
MQQRKTILGSSKAVVKLAIIRENREKLEEFFDKKKGKMVETKMENNNITTLVLLDIVNKNTTISGYTLGPFLQIGLYSFVGVVSLVTNLTIILVFSTNKLLKTRSNQLLINLAVSDIFIALIGIPIQSINLSLKNGPLTVDIFCQLHGVLVVMSFLFSNFNLCLIAVYRYLLIVKTKLHDAIFSTVKLPFFMIANYIIVTLICLPSVLGWGKIDYNKYRGHCMVVWEYSLSYLLFLQFLSFSIPLVIVGFCYYKVLRFTSISRKRLSLSAERIQSISRTQDLRLTFMLMTVFGCFLICFMPYCILLYYEGLFHKKATQVFSFCAMFFAYFNGMMDFFIYAIMNREFRNILKNNLKKAFRKR